MENHFQIEVTQKEDHFLVIPSHSDFHLLEIEKKLKAWAADCLEGEDAEFKVLCQGQEISLNIH